MKKHLLFLFIFPLFLLAVGCGGVDQGEIFPGDNITENNPVDPVDPNQGNPDPTPQPTPTVTPNPGPTLEIVPSDVLHILGAKDLESAHQEYADRFGLNYEDVKATWADVMGTLIPSTMELSVPNLNQFFQFVRMTGGNSLKNCLTPEAPFACKNESAAIFNDNAHVNLKEVFKTQDSNAMQWLKINLELQAVAANWMKNRILTVAEIYGVEIGDVSPAFNSIASQFALEITDKIAAILKKSGSTSTEMYVANLIVAKDLIHLLESVSFAIQGSDYHISFLKFSPLGEEELVLTGFRVRNRVYGAVETTTLHF